MRARHPTCEINLTRLHRSALPHVTCAEWRLNPQSHEPAASAQSMKAAPVRHGCQTASPD